MKRGGHAAASPGLLKRDRIRRLQRCAVEVRTRAIAERLGVRCWLSGGTRPLSRRMVLQVALDETAIPFARREAA